MFTSVDKGIREITVRTSVALAGTCPRDITQKLHLCYLRFRVHCARYWIRDIGKTRRKEQKRYSCSILIAETKSSRAPAIISTNTPRRFARPCPQWTSTPSPLAYPGARSSHTGATAHCYERPLPTPRCSRTISAELESPAPISAAACEACVGFRRGQRSC